MADQEQRHEQKLTLGDWMKRRRVTYQELASRSHVNPTTLLRIVKGQTSPQWRTREDIAAALELESSAIAWPTREEAEANKPAKESAEEA